MTSEYWLTKNKFNLNIFALQNLKFNSGLIGDVNILNCDNIIKTDQLKIFDEMLASKNIVAMYNPNYKSLNKLQRQSLVEKNDQLTSEMINKYEVEFNETNNHFQHLVRTHLTDSLELIKPVNFIPSSESKMTKPTKAIISFERSMNDSIIRAASETTFSSLVNEVQSLKISNKKISDDNDALVKELKKLSQMLEVVQFNSKIAEKQASGGIPPPPPPPPPPLPLSSQKTPKNNKMHTPRKSSIPQIEKRPVITMDDLLKVTLRKAPKIDKEKPKAASDPQPVISLEMLKNVKLKSIKQRSQNYKVRSPIGLKNRNRFQNVNLSPIMAGAVSPLSRILSRGESVRRKPRKILVSPREDEETH
ncbi:Protein of unknown function [Cotesia congregata]|uniref:Uncharacterized protein n=1 Tax=Cotesia congregata TaxID=51543 RepID=A0A8J2HI65_COTCN|nr:Protein of unknown function [Cotesia congregata]